MLEPLADPSRNFLILQQFINLSSLELEEELSKKTSDIRKLAYDLSAKLKSMLNKRRSRNDRFDLL